MNNKIKYTATATLLGLLIVPIALKLLSWLGCALFGVEMDDSTRGLMASLSIILGIFGGFMAGLSTWTFYD